MLDMLDTLSGPIIGAVIGYCTNYIAVKMLFYPRKEIRIGGWKVPFTPGAIPKGKPRLAKGIGNIVANTLLTEEDIRKKILTPETEAVIVDKIMEVLSSDIQSGATKLLQSEENYEMCKEQLAENLTGQILDALKNIDLGGIIAQEGERVIKEKVQGTMLAMFLSDEMLSSFIQPIGGEIVTYIDKNGRKFIKPEISSRVNDFEKQSLLELCGQMNLDEVQVRELMSGLYREVVGSLVSDMMKQLDIQGLVEEKINQMDVLELEKLVLTIMKKELDTIVNLGALVGFILGAVNIFI